MVLLNRVLVPLWVTYATIPLGPVSQFLMIHFNFPKWMYLLLPFLLTAGDPLVIYSEPFHLFVTSAGCKLLLYLRILDVGLLPKKLVRHWTVSEYMEYLTTFHVKESTKVKTLKNNREGTSSQPQRANSIDYYGKLAWKLFYQYVLYHFLIYYMRAFMVNKNPVPRQFSNPLDVKTMIDNLVFGATLCILLSLNYTIYFHFVCHIYDKPFEPVMNSPFFSTSLKDFWSNRWNMMIKENLARVGFKPTVQLLSKTTSSPKTPAWHYMVAGLSAFFLSGLIHEWAILVMVETTDWENFIFFLMHGILTTAEVVISKLGKRFFKFDFIQETPKWIMIPLTYFIFLTTSSFFLNPWVRDNLLLRLQIPLITDFIPLK